MGMAENLSALRLGRFLVLIVVDLDSVLESFKWVEVFEFYYFRIILLLLCPIFHLTEFEPMGYSDTFAVNRCLTSTTWSKLCKRVAVSVNLRRSPEVRSALCWGVFPVLFNGNPADFHEFYLKANYDRQALASLSRNLKYYWIFLEISLASCWESHEVHWSHCSVTL